MTRPSAIAQPKSSRKGVLRVRIENHARHWTLAPEGEVDLSNAGFLEQAISRAEASAAETVTIDLRSVAFIDLSGVRAILRADARLAGRLRLVKGTAAVQSVFRLTGAETALRFDS